MIRKIIGSLVLFVFVVSLNGCAAGRKQKDLELQGLRNQVSALESKLDAKDEEIMNLREALMKSAEDQPAMTSKKKVVAEVKSRPNTKQIQIALENAGYNPGRLDGRMGKRTREAIRAFQRDNNLRADGKVGKMTWALLGKYLYKKTK
ncbi:MAG: peptidoglycan-binding protein [Candidatus Omnitrophota bacterium]|jgi:peptidoglycan hydrolase-like protein with peptidoglycan-binding domain